jgi:putative ABC transport system permease protein
MEIASFHTLLTESDAENIKRKFPQVKYTSIIITKSNVQVNYKNRSTICGMYGVENDYFKMKLWPLTSGRYFTDSEMSTHEKVVIIGATVMRDIFIYEEPVGNILIINNVPFKVIGVLSELGESFGGKDFDNVVVIPYGAAQRKIIGNNQIDRIYVSVYSDKQMDEAVEQIKDYLNRAHMITSDANEFRITTSKQKLEMAEYISKTLSMLLAGIASISLFVGGVGIMNIMLVSVSERTREIGIRMAIGAKRRDILSQFLIESVTLSGLGGIVGIILGLCVYYLITYIVDWPYIFSVTSILLSFIFACAVGIFFGYYPAKKAADLKPIEALRYE